MRKLIQRGLLGVVAAALGAQGSAAEFHVAVKGADANAGTADAPFRTIQHAADIARPGDVITVHAGIFRERVNPPRGGTAELKRIVYQAAPGENVELRGSEVVKNWSQAQGDVWKVVLPNSFFGSFNPYTDLIHGDWFNGKGRDHHTGAVYLNGEWLTEAAKLDEVMMPAGTAPEWVKSNPEVNPGLWFAQADGQNTVIWAQFKGVNPNEQLTEINVRRTVFYPEKPGCNFITVRGFVMRHAATPWAPPTAEQIGLLGTHWSKAWIIENNVIRHSICSGISLGKYGDAFDNTSANSAEGYVKTIQRAQSHPIAWTKENIGHHIVRNNTVSHCEQAGIVGSLGPAFCIVTGNTVHDIHVRRLFTGAEMAGIKFHGAIDTEVSRNRIYRTTRGLWLDWMAQGTRVTQNILHDNLTEDLFVEVNHGPFLVDNNFFCSSVSLLDMSEGGAYAHNYFGGKLVNRPELKRQTPVHPAHKTKMAGLINIHGGDNRFFNNVFLGNGGSEPPQKPDAKSAQRAGYGLWSYDDGEYPIQTGSNVYLNGARPFKNEKDAIVVPGSVPRICVVEEPGRTQFSFQLPTSLPKDATKLVTTDSLGKARIPNLRYENSDGTPLRMKTDFSGNPRNEAHPTPGPLEDPAAGPVTMTW